MQCAAPYVLENSLCLTAHQLLPNESKLESMVELVGYTVRFRKLWDKVSFAQFQRVFVSPTRAWASDVALPSVVTTSGTWMLIRTSNCAHATKRRSSVDPSSLPTYDRPSEVSGQLIMQSVNRPTFAATHERSFTIVVLNVFVHTTILVVGSGMNARIRAHIHTHTHI